MSNVEPAREEIESVNAEREGKDIDNPGVPELNLTMTELYKKEKRFGSSVSGKS